MGAPPEPPKICYPYISCYFYVNCNWLSGVYFLYLFLNCFIIAFLFFRSLVSYIFALHMNLRSSCYGANDFWLTIGFNRYRPLSVLTLDRTTYSQLAKTTLFVKLGHDVMIMESLERPCSLCPVDAVDMFTGSMVICRLIVVSNDDTRDGRMLTVTSFRSWVVNCRIRDSLHQQINIKKKMTKYNSCQSNKSCMW